MATKITIEKVQRLLDNNPNKIPVIIHKRNDSKNVMKFMIPTEATLLDFLFVLRKRIKLDSTQAIFLSAKNSEEKYIMISADLNMQQIYDQYKNDKLLLELIYCEENTFG